jgi:hypothetical protein
MTLQRLKNLLCPFNSDSVDNPETTITANFALLLPRFKLRDKFPLTLLRSLHQQPLDGGSVSRRLLQGWLSL